MTTTAILIQNLSKMIEDVTDPAELLEIIMREYRCSGDQAKTELVMALVMELGAYRAMRAAGQ